MNGSLLKRRCLERGITIPERFVLVYEDRAAALGISGETVTTRTVERWWSGRSERPRNAARLILEAEFGEPVETLMALSDDSLGLTSPSEDDVRSQVLADITRRGRRSGWSVANRELQGIAFLVSERDAASIRTFQTTCVPGPLQIKPYAEAIYEADRLAIPADERRRRLETRMARKEMFERDHPPEYQAILDEAILHRLVGGAEVMVGQLVYLADMARRGLARISVYPFSAGAHPSMEGSFTIHDFADQDDSPAVYLGTATDDLYLEQPEEVAAYRVRFDRMAGRALSPEASLALIDQVVARLKEERPA